MAKGKQLELYIRFALGTDKSLVISAGAGQHLIGYSEVNVYEKDDVIAIEAVWRGTYHISIEQGRSRAVLCSKELNRYIREKFNCVPGSHLPAWTGIQEGVIFFSARPLREGEACFLDKTWVKLMLDYNRRTGGWSYVHDNWIEFNQQILDHMADTLAVYQSGSVTVLCPDENGPLEIMKRRQKQKRLIVSHSLAEHLRNQCGALAKECRLHALVTEQGWILLASDEDKIFKADLKHLEAVILDETRQRFLTVNGKKGFYLSSQTWKSLGHSDCLSAYICGDWLALKPTHSGGKQVRISGYVKTFCSVALANRLNERYRGVRKFYMLPHGKLWLLQPQPTLTGTPPNPERFSRLELDVAAAEKQHTRIQPKDWRVSAPVNAETAIVFAPNP